MRGSVELIEVSPRDGLQNEKEILSIDRRRDLIERALAAGLRRVEVASFVNPARVPQMAGAEEIVGACAQMSGLQPASLVLNMRGFERARDAGAREINVVVVASETFSQRNQGTSIDGGIERWLAIAKASHEAGIRPCLTIAASFGCPFEGEIDAETVGSIVQRCMPGAPGELIFADTIGCGVPAQVEAILRRVRGDIGDVPLRFHFHDTRNTALANVITALELGVRRFDTSLGGSGGCPFAPAATGNVATEDVVYALHRSGWETGVDLSAAIDAAGWLEGELGHDLPSALKRAGAFPPAA